jgi:hypothetical protein
MAELEVVEGGAATIPVSTKYRTTIFPEDTDVPDELAAIILDLERLLECKIWLIIQQGQGEFDAISETLYWKFVEKKSEIVLNERVALLIHSPGGHVGWSYRIVRLFQRRTDQFFAVVPLYAKSAATLIAIGGKEIIMGADAELGPLDVQIFDPRTEEMHSALEHVQSFWRLNEYGLAAFDKAMQLLCQRTGKKPIDLIRHAVKYAASIIDPLVAKIDAIELTRKFRELHEAEGYAQRVMRPNYTAEESDRIAKALTEGYPTHGFVIDRAETGLDGKIGEGLGLHVLEPSAEIERDFSCLIPFLRQGTFVGRIVKA